MLFKKILIQTLNLKLTLLSTHLLENKLKACLTPKDFLVLELTIK